MGAPIKLFNNTKKEFIMNSSGRYYQEDIEFLIRMFRSGMWVPTDDIVFEQHMWFEIDDGNRLELDEDFSDAAKPYVGYQLIRVEDVDAWDQAKTESSEELEDQDEDLTVNI